MLEINAKVKALLVIKKTTEKINARKDACFLRTYKVMNIPRSTIWNSIRTNITKKSAPKSAISSPITQSILFSLRYKYVNITMMRPSFSAHYIVIIHLL